MSNSVISRRAVLAALSTAVFSGSAKAEPPQETSHHLTAAERAAHHAEELAAALEEMSPGEWLVELAPECGFALIHRRSQ